MIKIKFSHKYDKMPANFSISKLLEVLPIKLQDLSLDFVLYDTSYNWGSKVYPLPKKGDYMILVLQADSGNGAIWTTIRSQKGQKGIDKLSYYRSHIGEMVECVVNE